MSGGSDAVRRRARLALAASLHKLRAQTIAAGPARIEPNRTDEASVGAADEDAQALSEMLQAISSRRNQGQAEMLARIDRALRRLEETPHDFGFCRECDEEIPLRRLQLVPWAELCADCQAKQDPRRGQGRRKLTDYL
jgi:DnaK suppressor protein